MRVTDLALCLALAALVASPANAFTPPKRIPAPANDAATAPGPAQTVVLAGGCYWGMQAVFEHIKGVKRVVAGFSGAQPRRANDSFGFGSNVRVPVESVQITYDPGVISYAKLLHVYFSVAHDPTEVNQQGPDHGPQYRSNIYYANDAQKQTATAYMAQLEAAHAFAAPIATRVDGATSFYAAPNSEQDYYLKYPTRDYIVAYDHPKLVALKTLFPDLYLETPTTYPGQGA